MQVGWELMLVDYAQMEFGGKDVGMEKKWDVAQKLYQDSQIITCIHAFVRQKDIHYKKKKTKHTYQILNKPRKDVRPYISIYFTTTEV